MLQTIIKRDGTHEAFDPIKLNKWSEWSTEDVRGRVDWSGIVTKAVKSAGVTVGSQELQEILIKHCVRTKLWPYYLMAGRLYSAIIRKEMYPNGIPSVKLLHTQMVEKGLMIQLDYSVEEYELIENIIDHDQDMHMAYFQVKQLHKKYGLANRVKGIFYETPQFVFMRMAMHLAQDEPILTRMEHLKKWYKFFSSCIVNAPTPNYTNLGTKHNGYASCCLYTTKDTAASLAVGDFIAYTMTYMSAGIGGYIGSRSLGDPVRGGSILHQGKLPYYRSLAGAVKANLQGGRGGACTSYYSVFDPEIETLIMLQNPRTPVDAQNRDIHFAVMFNRLVARKVAKNENIFLFNVKTAPDLHKAFFSSDDDLFEEIYNKYESDESFPKTYLNARDLIVKIYEQRNEVATLYTMNIGEVNRHTAFKEPIYSSNLCLEVTEPTKGYNNVSELYREDDDVEGEVATCSLGGIVVSKEMSDDDMFDACYYALKMIDKCIHMSHYELPHVGYTAKRRLNAGVGMLGLAYHLAKLNLKYDTPEGLAEIHRVSERHAYFMIRASLKLGQELGNAPWIHKTKWPEGWLPIDTYKKTVDQITPHVLHYDWEALRAEIIANGGIRNSCLINHMPTESSSKAAGVPNSIYPVRDLTLKKTDLSNALDWCAPDNDILEDQYQLAWEISTVNQIKYNAVVGKWTDQAISADGYRDRSDGKDIMVTDLIEEFLAMMKYGNKTQYYMNTYSVDATKASEIILNETVVETINPSNQERGCASGVCTL
jgi:ribonucleoside-diphosphate reductase alpha chain